MKKLLLGAISLYQKWISPCFPPRCRYIPTCSQYAYEAIAKYGPWKGGYLAQAAALPPLFPQGSFRSRTVIHSHKEDCKCFWHFLSAILLPYPSVI